MRTRLNIFLQWLYTKKCAILNSGQGSWTSDGRYMRLAKLYVLGDKYDIIKLKNFVIDRYLEL